VTFSERALERVRARTHPVPFYFDTKLLNGYFGAERSYHYTAPISMIYALVASLEEIEAEGLEARYVRHREVSAALRRGLAPLGLTPLVPVEQATPMLTTVCYPAGVDDVAFRKHLRQQHHIEVGGGLGPLAGKVFRVGLMGHGARLENVLRALAAFGDALAAAGHTPDVSAALAAVHGD
jgi:alanine-glyoxylate transaminase/serine-glyoxylate transaminase/serine-pyruvate transaminase